MVYEVMQLQESILFELDLGVKATQTVGQYTLHYVTYESEKVEVATSNGLRGCEVQGIALFDL